MTKRYLMAEPEDRRDHRTTERRRHAKAVSRDRRCSSGRRVGDPRRSER